LIIFILFKSIVKAFRNQKYEEIQKNHNPTNLFIDTEFLADQKSLYCSDDSDFNFNRGDVVWKRSSVSKIFYFQTNAFQKIKTCNSKGSNTKSTICC
jgi:hypothetical protein